MVNGGGKRKGQRLPVNEVVNDGKRTWDNLMIFMCNSELEKVNVYHLGRVVYSPPLWG